MLVVICNYLYIYSRILVIFGTDNLDVILFNNLEFRESGHIEGNISLQGEINFALIL